MYSSLKSRYPHCFPTVSPWQCSPPPKATPSSLLERKPSQESSLAIAAVEFQSPHHATTQDNNGGLVPDDDNPDPSGGGTEDDYPNVRDFVVYRYGDSQTMEINRRTALSSCGLPQYHCSVALKRPFGALSGVPKKSINS